MIVLEGLSPAQFEAWQLLFQLEGLGVEWVLIGGQMVALLAAEHDARLPRATDDADVLVDVRASPRGTERISRWLLGCGLDFEGIGADGIGHRFSRTAADGRAGRVVFDVLAPEGLSARSPTRTIPPARTVSVPGGTFLLRSSRQVEVSVSSMIGGSATGSVRAPSLLAALAGKGAATAIVGRVNPERDLQDAALLLSVLPAPRQAAAGLTRSQRADLRRLRSLTDPAHEAWRLLDPTARRVGQAAAALLLQTL